MLRDGFEEKIDDFRHFSRFFTRRLGVLRESLLHSPYSLAEVRIMFGISHRDGVTASDLSRDLGLDPGYLSRILAGLERKTLVDRSRPEADGRRRILSLTPAGEDAFGLLDARSREEVSQVLGGLSEGDQSRLIEAMKSVEKILDKNFKFSEPFFLRDHEPGDMGWVVYRHGVLYEREYGWNGRFEALVARIVADFAGDYDPAKERCWIAEMEGERVGCIFLVDAGDRVAKLRLLPVEPEARGLGLGKRLVEECVSFARGRGYEKLTLWTNSALDTARHIYEEQGFELVEEEEHDSFGQNLVGQNWELDL